MIGIWHRSNAVTIAGVVVAGLGVGLTRFDPGWAVVCLVVAGVCDLLDGSFARRFVRDERTRAFGIELDSLADMVDFVVLPVAVLLAYGPPWWAVAVVTMVYGVAAVTRLAFFNVTTDGTPAAYRGLPVTYAALALPVTWLVLAWADAGIGVGWAIAMAVLAVLFVLDLPVPKPRGRATIGFLGLAVVVVVGIVVRQVWP